MSKREESFLIEDIAIAIESIIEYTKAFTYTDYLEDQKTRHAVERNFEIIGEASTRLSTNFKTLHPHIEWRIIKDFRNFIIHDYFGINADYKYSTVKFSPPLAYQFSCENFISALTIVKL